MTRIRSRSLGRRGFTLIELLVVIAIIAILVSLTAAGVMKVLWKIPEVQTRTDIGQMDVGIGSFMSDYNLQNPPPSYLLLAEDGSQYAVLMSSANPLIKAASTQTVNFLQQWFGRSFIVTGKYDWNGNGKIDAPYTLEGEQCLVFYLGGIPTYSGTTIGMTGFCPNVANPALPAVAGTTRKGPYFNFLPVRLTLNGSQFPVYLDAWDNPKHPTGQGWPYAFFSASGKINGYNPLTGGIGGDCAGIGAFPYFETTATGNNFVYNNRYQIISAGQDSIFGSVANGTLPWDPSVGAAGKGHDDQANFSSKLLGAPQQ